MSETEVIVAVAGRARGLAGELFLDLRTDSPDQRFQPDAVVWAGTRALTVRGFRLQSGRGLVRFHEVADRDQAEALTGVRLTVRIDPDETAGGDDEFYDHQLIGLSVVPLSDPGRVAGRIVRVEHPGAQDLLVVATPAGERLIPFVDALVPEVDLAGARVVVSDIPGLLEDADEA